MRAFDSDYEVSRVNTGHEQREKIHFARMWDDKQCERAFAVLRWCQGESFESRAVDLNLGHHNWGWRSFCGTVLSECRYRKSQE